MKAEITHASQYRYWDAYRIFLDRKSESKQPQRSRFYWQRYSLRIKGFSLDAVYNIPQPGQIAFAFALQEGGVAELKHILAVYQPDLERALGYPLHWADVPVDQHSWLYTSCEADVRDEKDWVNQFAWYHTKHAQFSRVITPFLDRIRARR